MNKYYDAREYFRNNDPRITIWESKGITWVMHHKDISLRHDNPARYWQWNIEDLLPMTDAAHKAIHHTGKVVSEETRKKLSENSHNAGENNGNYGKRHPGLNAGESSPMYGKHLSEEHRRKLSEASRGENNPMYGVHRYKELNPNYGKHWYNNGTVMVMAKECPEGFVPGMLKKGSS